MRNYRTLSSGVVGRARGLRRNATDAEQRLWSALRQMPGMKFRRQVPHGPYVADFLCFSGRLIIEVDGGQHAERAEADALRTRYFEEQGYRVIRFWNHDVLENVEGVAEVITRALENPLSFQEREGPASRSDVGG